MNLHAVIMIAATGLANAANAQNFSLWLEPSGINPSGNFTVSVYGDADVGDYYRGGSLGLEVVPLSGPGSVMDITWEPGEWSTFNTDFGYGGDGVHRGVIFGEIFTQCVPFPCTHQAIGELIGSFTIDIDPVDYEIYQIDLVAGQGLGMPQLFTIEVADEITGEFWNDNHGTLELRGTTVTVVPSPAGFAAFVFSGLLVTHRVRR